MKALRIIPIVLFALSPIAGAESSFKPLILIEKAIDSFNSSAPKFTVLQRTYQSRRLNRGFLGYGWCLDFNKTLDFSQPEGPQLLSCERDVPIRFSLSTAENNIYIYRTLNNKNLSLISRDNTYFLKDKNNTIWSFNNRGQLMGWKNGNNKYQVKRDPKTQLITRIQRNKAPPLRIQWKAKRKLIAAIHWKDRKIEYEYKGHLLKKVNAPNKTLAYAYDTSHNLSEIYANKRLLRKITYNLKNDTIQSLTTDQIKITYNSIGKIKSIKNVTGKAVTFFYHRDGSYKSMQAWKDIQSFNPTDKLQLKNYMNVASRFESNIATL